MSTKYMGQLEVDEERGVIYFHSNEGLTLLRIQRLPTPIPALPGIVDGVFETYRLEPTMLDICYGDMVTGHKTSWQGRIKR
jgi:hypothetical protein